VPSAQNLGLLYGFYHGLGDADEFGQELSDWITACTN
jgi:hypothetical protein